MTGAAKALCLWVQIVLIIYDISINSFCGLQLEKKTQERSERAAWTLQWTQWTFCSGRTLEGNADFGPQSHLLGGAGYS